MAKKIAGYVKLQIPAGKATPAPPVGPALGQHGINIAQFVKEFNERTAKDAGLIIPVIITVYADRSFTVPLLSLPRLLRCRYFLRRLATLRVLQVSPIHRRSLRSLSKSARRSQLSRWLIQMHLLSSPALRW